MQLGNSIWKCVVRGECSSVVAHLSAFAESRVRIPTPCKYCKAVSSAVAEATKNRKKKRKTQMCCFKNCLNLFIEKCTVKKKFWQEICSQYRGGGLLGKIILYSLLAFIFYSLRGGGIRIFIHTENSTGEWTGGKFEKLEEIFVLFFSICDHDTKNLFTCTVYQRLKCEDL